VTLRHYFQHSRVLRLVRFAQTEIKEATPRDNGVGGPCKLLNGPAQSIWTAGASSLLGSSGGKAERPNRSRPCSPAPATAGPNLPCDLPLAGVLLPPYGIRSPASALVRFAAVVRPTLEAGQTLPAKHGDGVAAAPACVACCLPR